MSVSRKASVGYFARCLFTSFTKIVDRTHSNVPSIGAEARWSRIAENAHTPEIGIIIDKAMQAIEQENPSLRGILPKNYARPELAQRRLGDIADIFTSVSIKEHGDTKDILVRTYGYMLSKCAEQEGRNAGEFYAHVCIVKTLVEILEPYKGRV